MKILSNCDSKMADKIEVEFGNPSVEIPNGATAYVY